jgi:hypothetical protein
MEKPAVISPRVYSRHRAIIKKASRKLRVSEAEVVRRAIEHSRSNLLVRKRQIVEAERFARGKD